MNLSALSIRYPRVLLVVLLTVIVWGSAALVLLPRQEEPVLTWRLANVVTRLPGAPVERMESLVTDVLEKHVEEVDEVEHIYSVSRAGLSLLQIELSDEVTEAEPVWQKVRHKLAQAVIDLPPGVVGPDLDDEIMGTFAQLVAVAGDSADYRQLKD
ncbi:MAG: efflux RND transporter permease subunit, partial [Actinomycetia bacterium]|nr:efflux RND transporter permease subunit [Actinomycetes bacterium]